jgi:lipopolysaccharide assembly outer membrane protein LptD (OstA)
MYTASTLKGNTISNAFFWAISRSQDATFNYDWFSKTGHGFGREYRYVRSRSSSGDARFYMLNERAVTAEDGTGQIVTPGRRSFDAGDLARTCHSGPVAAPGLLRTSPSRT